MNERIKECWIKAAREDSGDKWDTQEEFIERFAELIVRECIDQAHAVANLRGITDDMIYGADTVAVVISKHFGVK